MDPTLSPSKKDSEDTIFPPSHPDDAETVEERATGRKYGPEAQNPTMMSPRRAAAGMAAAEPGTLTIAILRTPRHSAPEFTLI